MEQVSEECNPFEAPADLAVCIALLRYSCTLEECSFCFLFFPDSKFWSMSTNFSISQIRFNGHLRKKGISGQIKVSYEDKTLSVEVSSLLFLGLLLWIH